MTDRTAPPGSDALVFHPPVLALGIGCERGCSAAEISDLARSALAEAGLAAAAVAVVVSLDLKLAEAGIHALAVELGVPARFFPASRLLAETPRLSERSEAVFRATGCWGVAEGAALAAAGRDAVAGRAEAQVAAGDLRDRARVRADRRRCDRARSRDGSPSSASAQAIRPGAPRRRALR